MKICVIGNSHVGCLKLGWDLVRAEFPGVALTFFAARGRMMRGLEVDDGKLVARNAELKSHMAFTSGGVHEILPQDYDGFVMYGLALSLPRLQSGVSMALRRAAAADFLRNTLMFNSFAKLRSVTDKMIWVGPAPMETAHGDRYDHPMLGYPSLIADLQSILDDPMATVLGQPQDTVLPTLTTLPQFGGGALRLPTPKVVAANVAVAPDDTKHMNAEFGALWLRANLPRVAG